MLLCFSETGKTFKVDLMQHSDSENFESEAHRILFSDGQVYQAISRTAGL